MILAARGERWAALAALLLFIALGLWGARYHWVEQAGTAERDGYVRQAEQLRAGSLPRDPYRPLLYPLAAAALATLTGDAFAAARLISNLAAAALAWLAFACGRRLAGAAAGGWAMALVAVNPNLWILGQHATTDMLFAALGAAALLAGMMYLESPALAPAVAAGLAFGLAAFTRSNAVFLVPPLLAAWWLARPPADAAGRGPNPAGPGPVSDASAARPRARRASHLAAAAAASLTGLLPHWALREAAFGNPFHDENWKNLAWKIHGYPDWSYLDRVPYRGLGELLRTDAAAVVRAGWEELVRFAAAGLPQLLGTWAHVLLFLAGAAYALWHPRSSARSVRSAWWLLASGALFITATAFTFFTWGRLLLLLLPPAGAFSGVLPASPAPPAPGAPRPVPGDGAANLSVDTGRQVRLRRLRRAACTAVGLAAVLGLAVKTFAYRLPAFIADHPYAEVAALRRLDATLPAGGALAGSSPFLGRYLRHRYVDLPDAFGAEIRDPRLYYARLAGLVRREKVSFLVIGAIDLRDRPCALLGPAPPVGWLQPWLQSIPARTQSPGIAVWRVIPAANGADVGDGVKGANAADAAGGLQKPAARAAEKFNHSAPPDARSGGA
jgi:hypothetical protein